MDRAPKIDWHELGQQYGYGLSAGVVVGLASRDMVKMLSDFEDRVTNLYAIVHTDMSLDDCLQRFHQAASVFGYPHVIEILNLMWEDALLAYGRS